MSIYGHLVKTDWIAELNDYCNSSYLGKVELDS
jgi:hypothetical protein